MTQRWIDGVPSAEIAGVGADREATDHPEPKEAPSHRFTPLSSGRN
jgi:hypothetical protein